jgi:hypothetical protein
MANFGSQNDVQESYPSATLGTGVPVRINITAPGSTSQGQGEASATIALAGAASKTLQLTAQAVDAQEANVSSGTVVWNSYGASPTAASFLLSNPNDVNESYPAPQTFAGDCTVSAAGLVTAKKPGTYVVEARAVSFSTSATMDASSNTKSSYAYGQIVLLVTA